MVFTPNKVFSEYISNVLPELGEDNTYDMTFYDLLCQNINEYKDIENFTDFISRYYKGNVDNYDMVKYKQSDEIIKDIDSYINNLLSTIKFNNKLEYDNFIEIDTEELNNMLNYKYNRFPLFERIKEMSKRIASNNYEGSTKNASSIEKKLKELLNIKLDLKDIFNIDLPDDGVPKKIVTVPDKVLGAATIFSNRVMQELQNELGEFFAILPSSIHEIIALPLNTYNQLQELLEIVVIINAGSVDPEDKLTDSVYYWDGKLNMYIPEYVGLLPAPEN